MGNEGKILSDELAVLAALDQAALRAAVASNDTRRVHAIATLVGAWYEVRGGGVELADPDGVFDHGLQLLLEATRAANSNTSRAEDAVERAQHLVRIKAA